MPWVRHVDLVKLAVLPDAHNIIDLLVFFFMARGHTMMI